MSSQSALKKGVFLLLSFLIAILLGIVALWNIPLSEEKSLSEIWSRTDGLQIVFAMLLISMSMPFVAMRWRALLQEGKKTSPALLTGILSAAFVLNLALPGPVGEVLSASMLSKRYQISIPKGLSALLVSRIIGLGSACAIAGIMYGCFPLALPPDKSNVLSMSAIVLSIGCIGLICLGLFPQSFLHYLQKLHLTGWKQKFLNIFRQVLQALVDTASLGKKPYLESIFWAFMGHLMVASGIYVAAASIGLNLSWTSIAFTYAASIAASVAMFMLPGSTIAWDMLFTTTLSFTGNIPLMEAGIITLVVRIQQLLVVLFGILVLWWLSADILQTHLQKDESQEQ